MNILKDANRSTNREENSNLFSRYFYWYLNETFRVGHKRTLNQFDIFKISKRNSAEYLYDVFKRRWTKDVEAKDKPNFPILVAKIGFQLSARLSILVFTMSAVKLSQTYFLRKLIESISTNGKEADGFYWATAVLLSMAVIFIIHHYFYYHVEVVGTRLKSGIMSLIFEKVLKISSSSINSISTGHVVTLFSSDAKKIQDIMKLLHFVWIGPLMLLAGVVIMWNDIGPSICAGVFVLIISVSAQSRLGKFFAKMRLRTVEKTDTRVGLMNEVITSMQVTKMYHWEDSFAKDIHQIRRAESNYIKKAMSVRAFNMTMFASSIHLVVLASLATFYAYGGTPTLPMVFQTFSILLAIRFEVIFLFPLVVQLLMDAYSACKRIEKLLLHEEIDTSSVTNVNVKTTPKNEESPEVSFENVTAMWNDTAEKPVFSDISFSCNKTNNLVMLIGPVGSGKSSILMTALNELKVLKGNTKIRGSIAYSPQQPWIFSGTMRQNILFGKPYNPERYKEVIEACCLASDIKSFEKGDLTLVGERGVSLSGGQKARICLARAAYKDADIYLLDDPLSAVDSKVGKQMFDRCINGLLKDKIVFLVTHQIQYLQSATDIVCLDNGTAVEGSFSDFAESGIDLKTMMSAEEDIDDEKVETNINLEVHLPSEKLLVDGTLSKSMISLHSLSSLTHNYIPDEYEEDDDHEESRQTGAITWRIYYDYIVQGLGIGLSILLVTTLIFGQICITFTDVYLADWIKGAEHRQTNNTRQSQSLFYLRENPAWNLYIFAGLVFFSVVVNLFRTIFFFRSLIQCSQSLHNAMFKAIVKAPVYFFDTNPVGKILNRFSRDVFLIDEEFPWIFYDFLNLLLISLSIIILNCISIPYLIILFIPLAIVFLKFRTYYLISAREIKRLEAISRSPLFTHVSATLAGLSTIRAFHLSKKVFADFLACIDYQAETWIMFLRTCRWFGQRLDFFAMIFNVFAIYAPVVAIKYSDVDPGMASVSLTYTLTLCGLFQFCVRQSAESDNLMVSTERIFEYARMDPEPDDGDNRDLPPSWPSQGTISVCNASFAYHNDLREVLKNLYFNIRTEEKIGIVGRTGAGKSSILNMLFRMAINKGEIKIDGYDISKLKLKRLRSSISVIPQDPVLFSGTLRRNLDPFAEYNDDDLWQSLEEVQLKERVLTFESKLETEISESGSNLSVGERQLICLARALLKKNKILMIDEATANVDHETDALIQKTIRDKFKKCTVLTIAHRLNTVMDSDRIMVLNEGTIVEFDVPYKLLQVKSGLLRKLIDQTGQIEAAKLEEQARNSMERIENVGNSKLKVPLPKHLNVDVNDRADSTEADICSGSRLPKEKAEMNDNATENIKILYKDSSQIIESTQTDKSTGCNDVEISKIVINFDHEACEESNEKSRLLNDKTV